MEKRKLASIQCIHDIIPIEEADVTDILGVRKWDIEERDDGFGRIIGEFPSDISKTDELRVQSYPELVE